MNFDGIYTKKVICLDTACEAGTAVGLYIDGATYDCWGIAVEGSQNFILAAQDIAGKDGYITIDSMSCLRQPEGALLKTAVGQRVLNRNGKELGSITDIVCGRKNIKIMLGEEGFAPYKIVAASDNYLVVNMRAAKPSVYASAETDIEAPETAYTEAEIAASMQNPSSDQFEKPYQSNHGKPLYDELYVSTPQPAQSYYQTGSGTPDYSFLLGRKVEREITDLTRTFYIAVGTIITEQILSNAKRAGKIADLAINSSKIQG